MRLLPQGKQLNIRLGILLAVVGLVVTTVSFSGTYAYDLRFFYLAIVGSVLSLYGMVLLANSRVVSERRTQRRRQTAGAPREWVRLQCPRCGTVFEEEGARPFQAVCPSCKASGLIA
jgi:hypothetical protein